MPNPSMSWLTISAVPCTGPVAAGSGDATEYAGATNRPAWSAGATPARASRSASAIEVAA